MRQVWAILLLLAFAILSPAQDVLSSWDNKTSAAWWLQNPTPDLWPKAADALQTQLEADYKQNHASVYAQPDFQNWLDLLRWIRLGLDASDLLANADNLKTYQALGQDDAVSHLFVEKLSPQDDKKQALALLLKLAQAQSADLHEYAALGVAYCLVFDQPFPRNWPHGQVRQSAVPIGDLDVVSRFNFYVQANRNKKLDRDLTQLSVEDLKFLVDSEVKLSELQYAQDKRLPYEDFAQAFFSINYDVSRTKSSENLVMNWPFPTYNLSDIEKNGGICVDQAYYACLLGKGRGIPTIWFTGQGSDGGHAWFGYLGHDLKWVMDCGRYSNQNYLKGYAIDPQTWQQVKDTTIENLVKNGPDSPNYQPAKTALAWARLHTDQPNYQQLLDEVRSTMPELAETWQTEADLIDASSTISLTDKKAFYQAWITQFQSNADLKVDGQTRLLALLKQANDPDAEGVQQDIIMQNRSSGADLSIKGSFSAIADLIQAQDWDGAKIAFERAVRDYKDQGGGTFFNDIVEPYAATCVQYGQIQQARAGLKFTEDRMAIDPQSILGIEFADLKKKIDLLEKVMPDMDKWLSEIDEGNYEQAWNDGGKSFQAKAEMSKWVDFMNQARKPLGKCISRALFNMPHLTKELSAGSGQKIDGTFIFARYNSVFETQPKGTEVLVFQKEDDGVWRPMDYYVKPAGNP